MDKYKFENVKELKNPGTIITWMMRYPNKFIMDQVERKSAEVWITQYRKRKRKILPKRKRDIRMKSKHKHMEA